MELKLCLHSTYLDNPFLLLIVPYGIETWKNSRSYTFLQLLIVPYGIETGIQSSSCESILLLIVPYGIETMQEAGLNPALMYLLIVPYGIETLLKNALKKLETKSFNCTLWN